MNDSAERLPTMVATDRSAVVSGAAIQAKLDELIRVSAARNTLIGIETLTQDEIADIRATRAPKARRPVNGAQKEANKKVKSAVSNAMS